MLGLLKTIIQSRVNSLNPEMATIFDGDKALAADLRKAASDYNLALARARATGVTVTSWSGENYLGAQSIQVQHVGRNGLWRV